MAPSAHRVPRGPSYGAWVTARGHWGAQEDRSLTAMSGSRVSPNVTLDPPPTCRLLQEFPEEPTRDAPPTRARHPCAVHAKRLQVLDRVTSVRPGVTSPTAATAPPHPRPPALLSRPRTPLTQPGRPRRRRQTCRVHASTPPPRPPQPRSGMGPPGSRSHAPVAPSEPIGLTVARGSNAL